MLHLYLMEQKYVSPKEYAVMMGVTAQTVRNWIKEGKLKAIQPAGKNGRWFLKDG